MSTRQEIRKIYEYEEEIRKIGEYELKIHNRCKSHAYEQKISQKRVRAERLQNSQPCDSSERDDAFVQPVVEDPVDADRVPVETGAEPITIPCEPSSHLNTTNVSSAPSKTANFQLCSPITWFRKMFAASDGLKVFSMYVKSFWVRHINTCWTERFNRHVRSDMESENIELPWTLRHHFAM